MLYIELNSILCMTCNSRGCPQYRGLLCSYKNAFYYRLYYKDTIVYLEIIFFSRLPNNNFIYFWEANDFTFSKFFIAVCCHLIAIWMFSKSLLLDWKLNINDCQFLG